MPLFVTGIWYQIMVASSLLRYRYARWSVLAGFVTLWLATILAPDQEVTAWDWTRLLLIGVLAALSILAFSASRHLRISLATRQARIIGASTLLILSLLVSLTFDLKSTAIFALAFTIVTLQVIADRQARSPWLLILTLALLIPFWTWTALDAWATGLLLLIPIAILALIGDQHMREAASPSDPDHDRLSWRAHRLGSWLAVMLAAFLILVFGIFTSASNGWTMIGAIGAIALVAVEAGLPRPDDDPRRHAVRITDAAFAWIAFCWMVSL